MKSSSGKVLVLGRDERSFLSVIRSLGRKGLAVHVGWCPPHSVALVSRYIAQVHTLAPCRADTNWKEPLRDLLGRERFDLVIPCNDGSLIPLQMFQSELNVGSRLCVLSPRAFEVALDKVRTWQLARELAIQVPRGVIAAGAEDADAISRELGMPLVLKPRTSFTIQELERKREVRLVHSAQQLRSLLDRFAREGGALVQENFSGIGVGVEILADRGEVLTAFQHERIHEPRLGGGSSYRKSVPLRPALLEATRSLMRALDYTGVAMVEFKLNPDTGTWVLIEINARFWGSLPLAVAAGADFPWWLYQLLVEGRREFPRGYREGLYCRNVRRDLHWMRENFRARLRNPTSTTVPIHTVLAELLHVVTLRERWDTLTLDDPKPGLVEMAQAIKEQVGGLAGRLRASIHTWPLLRGLAGRRARGALQQAGVILFVCKGNICRSPFAAAYARARLSGTASVLSSGYYPKPGRPCPTEAIAVAREFGVNLEGHSSSVIDEKAIRAADVVFVFDKENLRTLFRQFPFAKRKIHVFAQLARQGDLFIADPFDGPPEQFRAVYQRIGRVLDESLTSLPSQSGRS